MLIAIAFLCAVGASDCEHEAVARVVVGQGITPGGCLVDGWAGAAQNIALDHGPEYRIVISCRRQEAPE